MKVHKPTNVKYHNLEMLRQIFRSGASFSSKELSERTGLSVVSINKLLIGLKESGEVITQEEAVVTGGRRATVYRYNPNVKQLLILQFAEAGTDMAGHLFVHNLFGEIINQWLLTADELPLELLKQTIHQILNEYPAIELLVFGIPGAELEGKLQIMDFEPVYNLNFRQLMEDEFSLAVLIENDINAATLSHSLNQATQDIFVSLYYPENYPPGAGIVINGKIFHGKHGLSGEIKHLPLEHQGVFPKDFASLEKQIEEVLQTIISMYDPTQIVVYTNVTQFSEIVLQEIRTRLKTIFPYFELPEIRLAKTFQEDYLNGLVNLGLNYLISKEKR